MLVALVMLVGGRGVPQWQFEKNHRANWQSITTEVGTWQPHPW